MESEILMAEWSDLAVVTPSGNSNHLKKDLAGIEPHRVRRLKDLQTKGTET